MSRRIIQIIARVLICISVLYLAFYVIKEPAPDEIVPILAARLDKRNVPVEEIVVTSQIPFDIEITIRRVDEYDGKDVVSLNLWNQYITGREARLMEKYGFHLNSYAIGLIDKNGKSLSWGQSFLSGKKQPFPRGLSKLDNAETAQVITDKLDLLGMTLEDIKVTTDIGVHNDVQYVAMVMSVPDLEVADSVFHTFFFSLTPFLNGINQDKGTRIAVCDIRIYDGQGNLMIRHITDRENTSETWWEVEGITQKWYPSPPPEIEDTPEPQATNTPIAIKDTPTPEDRSGKSTRGPYP